MHLLDLAQQLLRQLSLRGRIHDQPLALDLRPGAGIRERKVARPHIRRVFDLQEDISLRSCHDRAVNTAV